MIVINLNKGIVFLLIWVCLFACCKEKCNRIDDIGRKQGYWKTFNSDSSISASGYYLDGLPVGVWKYYDKENTLIKKIDYLGMTLDNYSSRGYIETYFAVGGDSIYKLDNSENRDCQLVVYNDSIYYSTILKSTRFLNLNKPDWERGYSIYSVNCSGCHSVDKEILKAKPLTAYIQSLSEFSNIKQDTLNHANLQFLTDMDIKCILEYIKNRNTPIR